MIVLHHTRRIEIQAQVIIRDRDKVMGDTDKGQEEVEAEVGVQRRGDLRKRMYAQPLRLMIVLMALMWLADDRPNEENLCWRHSSRS